MGQNERRPNVSHSKREKVISALISSRNLREAAKLSGVSESSIYRMLQDPEFSASYRAARDSLLSAIVNRLAEASHLALDTLVGVILDPTAKHHNKVSASKCILECTLKSAEFSQLQDITERLNLLERGPIRAVRLTDRTNPPLDSRNFKFTYLYQFS